MGELHEKQRYNMDRGNYRLKTLYHTINPCTAVNRTTHVRTIKDIKADLRKQRQEHKHRFQNQIDKFQPVMNG